MDDLATRAACRDDEDDDEDDDENNDKDDDPTPENEAMGSKDT